MKALELVRALKQVHDPNNEITLRWHTPASGPVVLLIISEKGGVGKSALAVALVTVAALFGLEVRLVDLDPRASASNELNIYIDKPEKGDIPDDAVRPEFSVNDLLYVSPEQIKSDDYDPASQRGAAADVFVHAGPAWPRNIQVLAAERALGNRETDTSDGLEYRLKASLEGDALTGVDLVVIDSPPRPGGPLVSSGIIAATHALVPTTLDRDGFGGVGPALRTTRITRSSRYLAELPVIGILRNIVDPHRTSIEDETDDDLHVHYNNLLLHDVAVPRYSIRRESRAAQVPFTMSRQDSALYLKRAYLGVLNEIAKRVA